MSYQHTNSKGVTYYLNSKKVTLRGGKEQTIYYFSKDERPLPIGLQIIGNYFREGQLLAFADRFQQVTDWHQRQPGQQ